MNIWDGKGSPPVGSVCEIKRSPDWTKVEVIADYLGQAVIAFDGDVELRDYSELRPLSSTERIAAEKREKAIRQMGLIVLSQDKLSVMDAVAALYDAGYRKFEIVEEDV